MLRVAFLIPLICCVVSTACAQSVGDRIEGPLSLRVDGDTVYVRDVKLRLHGIDALETRQRCGARGVGAWACGAWAFDQIRARFDGRHARCEVTDIDRFYNRPVARCFVAGVDVSRQLVRDGLAFAYRDYSMAYDLAEKQAAVQERGLHSTDYVLPKAYRAYRRKPMALPAGAPLVCAIKGNISWNGGTLIFHVPGQRDYLRTRITPARGERWFCSEAEARDAGWRKAKR